MVLATWTRPALHRRPGSACEMAISAPEFGHDIQLVLLHGPSKFFGDFLDAEVELFSLERDVHGDGRSPFHNEAAFLVHHYLLIDFMVNVTSNHARHDRYSGVELVKNGQLK